jgi:hypothetical protein
VVVRNDRTLSLAVRTLLEFLQDEGVGLMEEAGDDPKEPISPA